DSDQDLPAVRTVNHLINRWRTLQGCDWRSCRGMRLKSAGFEDGQIVLAVRLNPVTQLTHHLDHDYPLLVFRDGSSRASVDRRCNRACERFDLRLESRQIKRRIRTAFLAQRQLFSASDDRLSRP